MKRFTLKTIVIISVLAGLLSSCTSLNKTMREPNVRVELQKEDFELSKQVTAEAQETKIIGIDFSRLFKKETGTVVSPSPALIDFASIPVIGSMFQNRASGYALYELMINNPGYDVVIYPQYEVEVKKPILGIGFLTKITKVKVTARLGKLK